MIEEAYVSFEIAKLLKEKGFDEKCFALYNPDSTLIQSGIRLNNTQVGRVKGSYSAPTQQMAMKWLREVHNIDISIFPTIETDMIVREDYNYAIYKNKIVVYQSCSTSYEQTIETAIKYCLENLI